MDAWQVIVFAFVVLVPFALLVDFWPRRERCDAQGRPLPRDWRPAVTPAPVDEHH